MPLTFLSVPVAQTVKQQTASLHAEVEQVLLPRLAAIKSVDDYATILQMFYGYFHPVEQLIHAQITTETLPDINQRRTTGLIQKDLFHLNKIFTDTQCHQLPAIVTVPQAFGALYVLEGSTLGGRVITKMLTTKLPVSIPNDVLHFFTGYGEQTGPMWKAFMEALNQQTETTAICEAANQTFFYLKHWMQHFFDEQTNE